MASRIEEESRSPNAAERQSVRQAHSDEGEMAEWSIAAVLKTVELRGSGGSNPSLSAKENLQGIMFQPCRFFYAKKDAPKMHHPHFYTLLWVIL